LLVAGSWAKPVNDNEKKIKQNTKLTFAKEQFVCDAVNGIIS